ncbi:TetR/AcrR family transcriptional regulator [Kiloniella sp. b19]|uniref:TetR/AcrR family transcriptional regulator n=1 Tax=Kiloniella sp. GXU_MW_B19 TaxID=3141326 RepID=UPI0031D007C6
MGQSGGARVRRAWLETGYKLLVERGAAGLKLPLLCETMGLTKGSFYHHFNGLSDYKLALVKAWEEEFTLDVFNAASQNEDPDQSHYDITLFFMQKDKAIDHAVRTWAMTDKVAKDHLHRIDNLRIELLAKLFEKSSGLSSEEARLYAFLRYACFLGVNCLNPNIDDDKAREIGRIHSRAMLNDSKLAKEN